MDLYDLCKTYDFPFIVTDGKKYFKILSLCNFSFISLELKKNATDNFKTVLGGWVITPEQACENKWFFVCGSDISL